MAARALGFLLTEEDGLEAVSTLFAAVFENRHCNSNQFQGTVFLREYKLARPISQE